MVVPGGKEQKVKDFFKVHLMRSLLNMGLSSKEEQNRVLEDYEVIVKRLKHLPEIR